MRCREAELQLSVYRELTGEERAAVNAHLAICSACARLAAAYQAVDDRLAALPRLDPPPRIRAEVLARLGESQRPWARRGRRLLARLATVVLLIALAVGLRSWWFPPGPMPRTGAPEPLTSPAFSTPGPSPMGQPRTATATPRAPRLCRARPPDRFPPLRGRARPGGAPVRRAGLAGSPASPATASMDGLCLPGV